MTERELMIECIPQITEMALEIQKMAPEQYLEFKQEHLAEVRKSYPAALGFIKKIYDIIEWSLYGGGEENLNPARESAVQAV